MTFAFNKDKAAEIFLRAFKDCANNIITSLPSDSDAPEAARAIQTIAQQLNGDYARLVYVVEVIHYRIAYDETWAATAAVAVYELLAKAVDPNLSISSLPMRGPYLVRNELMKACQSQFQHMMTEPTWCRGFIAFLGQLCTTDRITSTTPGIIAHILNGMISSTTLNTTDNFDILIGFLTRAGPYLDGQAHLSGHLTTRLEELQQRSKTLKVSERLAVYGLVQLRERGWRTEELDEGSRSEQQVSEATSAWMSNMGFVALGEFNGR